LTGATKPASELWI